MIILFIINNYGSITSTSVIAIKSYANLQQNIGGDILFF